MVHHDGEKMSKSLGNLVMISDLLKTWSPDALRLYLAGHHYREIWSYDEQELVEAARHAEACMLPAPPPAERLSRSMRLRPEPRCTRRSIKTSIRRAAVRRWLRLANEILRAAQGGNDVRAAQQMLREMASLFGLRLGATGPEPRVKPGWRTHLKRFSA